MGNQAGTIYASILGMLLGNGRERIIVGGPEPSKGLQRMQCAEKAEVMDVELDAVIRFRRTHEAIECIILNITRDYTDVMAVAYDSRVCERKAIDLGILVPTERLLIKCTGRIIWHLESDELTGKREKHLVRIFVADISRVDQKRLDLFIYQNRAFVGSGRI